MDMNTFYGILVAIGLGVVISFSQKRKKQQSWQGVVTKIKKRSYDPTSNSEYDTSFKSYVDIYYRTDNGKKGKIHLYENEFNSIYSQLKEGDKLIKEAGKDYPILFRG